MKKSPIGPEKGKQSDFLMMEEVIELQAKLRQEQLLVSSERQNFQRLNVELRQNSNVVNELSWICAQHRQNLNNLIISKPEIGPRYCCHRANILENTRFVDAYKANGVKYSQVLAYTNLFTYLYNNPYQLAQVLAIGDQIASISNDQIASVVRTVATGLYGNAINSNDIQLVLRLLKELIQIQIVTSENPRRMLRAGSCSFARFYHSLHESLFSAKMFLTAALHDPVMRVLIEDEIPLEIDPVKAIQNWPARERLRRFGEEGSAEYEQKVKQYVQETINQLYKLTTKFIKSLCHRWCLFPATLRWLVQTMCFQLKRADFTEQCIYEMLTDMIFTNFICPAIVSPDLYGITDCPISETAQKNLITMGQILQMLALVKYQGKVDKKYADLFEKFEQNEIAELLLQLLPDFDLRMDSLIMANGNVEAEVVRSNVLVTQGDLNTFIDFLRNILSIDGLMVSGECRRKLGDILEQLPDKLQNLLNGNEDREGSPEKKQSLISLGKQTKQKLNKTINDDEASNDPESPEVVLSIPISIEQRSFELLSEEEVIRTTENEINNNLIKKEDDLQILSETNVGKLERQNEEENSEMIHVDKKKHFSLMNDDVSIGNTSDNLEAVSEAPSNHSVASSLELEENDQNDNLSDMVSANVSGRGSPNISGRDTPSSQITEGNEPRQPAIPAAKILNKTRSEIQDKFCKFELKKPLEGGDETVSIMSDTWSTDVLASDSETLDASSERERNFSTPLIPSSVILPGDNNFDPLSNTTNASNFRANCDISETQSESAWSTDVLLASDSEKMTEVDTDDNQSIAAKSDVTDAGQDSVAFRDGNNNNNRPQQGGFNNPDSPFFAPRNKNNNPESPIYQSRNPDSLFFGQRNNYNEANNELEEGLNRFSGLRQSRELSRNSSYQSDIGSNAFLNPNRNSFDRSNSTGTTNAKKFHPARQNSSESNQSSTFDGEMKSDSFDSWKGDVKGAKRRTQNEHLNIFNSGNVNSQANSSSSKARKNGKLPSGKGHFENDNQSHSNRGKHHVNHSSVKHNGSIAHCTGNSGTSSKREKIIKTNSNLSNPFAENVVSLEKKISFDDNNVILNEEIVEQRRTTMEQRNATFDGRRNGMMQVSTVSNKTSIKNGQKSVVNYENHEIIMRNNNKIVQSTCASSTSSVIYRDKDVKLIDLTNGTSSTTAEEQLIQKTQSLNLISNTAPEHKNVNGNCLPNGTITKHGKFTGAIPKSISFDATADKRTHSHHGHFHHHHNSHHNGHQEHHNNRSQSGNSGFLSKIKQGLKSRRSNRARNPQDFFDGTAQTNGNGPTSGNLIDVGGDEQNDSVPFVETGDDILAKYRRKVSTSSEATASDSTSGSRNSSSIKSKNSTDSDFRSHNGDLNNLVNDDQFLFNNAKKKLRIVFSSSDLHTGDFRHNIGTKYGSPLIVYLQIQLAQALNLQNMHQISYVQEAIRCLMMMPAEQHQKLIHEMQSDLIMRQSYLKYLMRFRQGLLSALKNVERFEERLKRDLEMCQRHLIACCVRMFLEKRQNLVEDLQRQFAELTVGDEKIDLLEEFIGKLILELEKSGMSSSQLVNARISIERILLQKLYRQVMFPNDDADILRDQMLKDHIRRLGKTVTPDHATLCIPQEYLVEAPWSYAQQQILQISAYKTALEKVRCVVRCIATIMDMLTMASAGRVPSADDLIPVLIFVLIKANPPYLQSTIQYVDCFMADRLSGEDHYGWIQFCAAVQFIKMMDN